MLVQDRLLLNINLPCNVYFQYITKQHFMTILNTLKIIFLISFVIFLGSCEPSTHTNWELLSPDGNIKVIVYNSEQDSVRHLSYRVERIIGDSFIEVIGQSPLGIVRNDNSFDNNLKFINEERLKNLKTSYVLKTGKSIKVDDLFSEMILQFKNINEQLINVIFRSFNDGIAFQYEFPERDSTKYSIIKELSGFAVPQKQSWMQAQDSVRKWGPAYEKIFKNGDDLKNQDDAPFGWCFPTLMKTDHSWVLLTEADLESTYFGAHLTKQDQKGIFHIKMPDQKEAMGLGTSLSSSTLPWKTPWRVMILGDALGSIIESNMVTNLSKPNVLKNSDWIKPGRASWSWWSSEGKDRELDSLIRFVDLAVNMNWEYSLVDANWNLLPDSEMDSLVNYAKSKNIGLLLWYNSGGAHNEVMEEPRDLMSDPVLRKAEFKRIHELGIKGIKVDFFQSDKPFIIDQYIGILKDAADEQLLVNFHGCTIPRGWRRTYPNLMSMESVMGAECYRFSQEFGKQSPVLNTIYAATRNVVGAMDYTPVTFSLRTYPHLTSYAHELALCVLFESGITHFADKISGFENTPTYVQDFLRRVPVTWDEIKYLDGMPGKEMLLARRKGDTWYVAGINGENIQKKLTINMAVLGTGNYEVTEITDGKTNTEFSLNNSKISGEKSLSIDVLPYGGFVVILKE